jgi:hypothetical protein
MILIVLAPVNVMAASKIVAQLPGNTIVQDDEGDLFLVVKELGVRYSLPEGADEESAPWTDIKTAKITQLGSDMVELSMVLQEPVPQEPSYNFLYYNWLFRNSNGEFTLVSVWWEGDWHASWLKPPDNQNYGPVNRVFFEDDTIKVRISLEDLINKVSGDAFMWSARVGRVHAGPPLSAPVDACPGEPTSEPQWAEWESR